MLHLSKTKLTTIPNAICPIKSSLKSLNCLYCPIHSLAPLACSGVNLNTLKLDYTSINFIEASFFDGLTVKELYMSSVKLLKVPDAIARLGKHITLLDLRNNPIANIEVGIFRNNTQLRSLYLSQTHLKTIPSEIYSLNQTLESLFLRSVSNITIRPESFCLLSQLQVIDLRQIQNTAFRAISQSLLCLKKLTKLSLDWSAVGSLDGLVRNNKQLTRIILTASFGDNRCNALPNLKDAVCGDNRADTLHISIQQV